MPNKFPKADKVTVSGFEDQATTIVLSGSDADGIVKSDTPTSLPSNGTLYIEAEHTQAAVVTFTYASNTFYFVPASNFSGPVSFSYNDTDTLGGASASPATVTVSVPAVNDKPVVDLNGAAAETSQHRTILHCGDTANGGSDTGIAT